MKHTTITFMWFSSVFGLLALWRDPYNNHCFNKSCAFVSRWKNSNNTSTVIMLNMFYPCSLLTDNTEEEIISGAILCQILTYFFCQHVNKQFRHYCSVSCFFSIFMHYLFHRPHSILHTVKKVVPSTASWQSYMNLTNNYSTTLLKM